MWLWIAVLPTVAVALHTCTRYATRDCSALPPANASALRAVAAQAAAAATRALLLGDSGQAGPCAARVATAIDSVSGAVSASRAGCRAAADAVHGAQRRGRAPRARRCWWPAT